jgi:hypothetical protein
MMAFPMLFVDCTLALLTTSLFTCTENPKSPHFIFQPTEEDAVRASSHHNAILQCSNIDGNDRTCIASMIRRVLLSILD